MAQATEALSKRKEHNKELEELIKGQKGMAKKELQKVLKRSTAHLVEIEEHITKGNDVLEKKQKNLKEIEPKEDEKKVEQNDFEMDFSANKSAVKSDKNEAKKSTTKSEKQSEKPKQKAEASKKEAIKEFKKTENEVKQEAKKIEDKAQAEGFDIQSLTEKNNKMWDAKLKES